MHNVLLIEDDFEFAEIITECLESDPELRILELITNETDARHAFASGTLQSIDAVLIDLQLQKSHQDHSLNPTAGLQLIEELRVEHGFCGRIIVLTNSNSLADGDRAMRAGCDGYLCKHMRMSDLPALTAELKMAINCEIVLISTEMRYVFLRDLYSAHAGQE